MIILSSLRLKIIVAFSCLMLLAVAIGGFSVYRLGEVKNLGRQLANHVVEVGRLGDLAQLSQKLRALSVLQHFALAANRESYAKDDSVARNDFSKAWSNYARTVSTWKEKQLSVTLRAAWQHFLAVSEEVADLDAAGQGALATSVVMSDLRAKVGGLCKPFGCGI